MRSEYIVRKRDTTTYGLVDMRPVLPDCWQQELLLIAQTKSLNVNVFPSSTSRRQEGDHSSMPIGTIGGIALREAVPWLHDISVSDEFRRMMTNMMGEEVTIPSAPGSDEYRIIMNIIKGRMYGGRGSHYSGQIYEPHIDNNGATLVLPVSSHNMSSNNEASIVMSLDPNSRGVFPVTNPDSLTIHPEAGIGIVFNGTDKPHYVLSPKPGETRVTIVFECYTENANESHRPPDLSEAIGLKN